MFAINLKFILIATDLVIIFNFTIFLLVLLY